MRIPAVDRDAILTHLVLALLQIMRHFASNFSQIAAADVIVRLEKNFTQL